MFTIHIIIINVFKEEVFQMTCLFYHVVQFATLLYVSKLFFFSLKGHCDLGLKDEGDS